MKTLLFRFTSILAPFFMMMLSCKREIAPQPSFFAGKVENTTLVASDVLLKNIFHDFDTVDLDLNQDGEADIRFAFEGENYGPCAPGYKSWMETLSDSIVILSSVFNDPIYKEVISHQHTTTENGGTIYYIYWIKESCVKHDRNEFIDYSFKPIIITPLDSGAVISKNSDWYRGRFALSNYGANTKQEHEFNTTRLWFEDCNCIKKQIGDEYFVAFKFNNQVGWMHISLEIPLRIKSIRLSNTTIEA